MSDGERIDDVIDRMDDYGLSIAYSLRRIADSLDMIKRDNRAYRRDLHSAVMEIGWRRFDICLRSHVEEAEE